MDRYEDDYEPRRSAGSRIGVLLVGLVVGALVMTAVWVGVDGNPLSDLNEVVFEEITITSVNLERNTLCWSEDPGRRDAGQICAILALDRELEVPMPGVEVLLGTVMLRPPGGEPTRQAVYVAPRDASADPTEPAPTESD